MVISQGMFTWSAKRMLSGALGDMFIYQKEHEQNKENY